MIPLIGIERQAKTQKQIVRNNNKVESTKMVTQFANKRHQLHLLIIIHLHFICSLFTHFVSYIPLTLSTARGRIYFGCYF